MDPTKIHINGYWFNNVSYYFWLLFDSADYGLTFIVWLSTLFISILSSVAYNYFFYSNFTGSKTLSKFFSNNFFENHKIIGFHHKVADAKLAFINKNNTKYNLYSWLNNKYSTYNNVNKLNLEDLFNVNLNKKWWEINYNYFLTLYKLTNFLNLSNIYKSKSAASNNFENFFISKNFPPFFNDYKVFNQSFIFNFFSSLRTNVKFKNDFKVNNSEFLNNLCDYNLLEIENKSITNNFLIKYKNGFFYFNNLNFGDLSFKNANFSEFQNINLNFINELNSSKWNRWLYKYSILHRKILKNSHKLTLTKKLINYSPNEDRSFNTNIWISENLQKFSNFNNFLNSVYSNLFNTNFNNFNNFNNRNLINKDKLNNIIFLNFYENSFFFFLKRFYFFNNLSYNSTKSSYKSKPLATEFNSFNKVAPINYILNSKIINNCTFNFSVLLKNCASDGLENYSGSSRDLTNNFNKIKDLFLLYEESDLYSKDNLKLFYWLTGAALLDNRFLFFNYFNYLTPNSFVKYNNNNFISQFNSYDDFDYINYYILINNDFTFLNDVILYNKFINF